MCTTYSGPRSGSASTAARRRMTSHQRAVAISVFLSRAVLLALQLRQQGPQGLLRVPHEVDLEREYAARS